MIADAVGAPPQGQLAQIARAQYQGPAHVGQPEEVGGPLPRLDVFKGDIVNRLSLHERVPNILEHLEAARADVQLVGLHPQDLHQPEGIGVGLVRGGEARHGVGLDVAPGQLEEIHGPGRYDEGVGGIQAAGDTDDHVADPRRLEPLGQALDLDVVGLVTSLVPLAGVGGDVRETGVFPGQKNSRAPGDVEIETDPPERPHPVAVGPGVLAEARETHPVLGQTVQIDVGVDDLRLRGEAGRFRQEIAVFVDHGVAVPGQIRRRFPRPRRRV